MLVLVTRADALARGQMEEMVTLYSFDKDMYSGKLTLKQSVMRKRILGAPSVLITKMIQFSPDDKFNSYHDSENGLTLWDVTTGNNITDKLEIKHDEYEKKNCNVHGCSPVDHQRLLLVDDYKYYIVSYLEKKSVKKRSQSGKKRVKCSHDRKRNADVSLTFT